MKQNLIQAILAHIFGHKYYCVTIEEPSLVNRDGSNPRSMSGYIFRDRESALAFYYQMKSGKRCRSLEIVSFRSRQHYEPFNNNYLMDLPSNY